MTITLLCRWSGLGVLIFRSELMILLGPMLVVEFFKGKLSFDEVSVKFSLSKKACKIGNSSLDFNT